MYNIHTYDPYPAIIECEEGWNRIITIVKYTESPGKTIHIYEKRKFDKMFITVLISVVQGAWGRSRTHEESSEGENHNIPPTDNRKNYSNKLTNVNYYLYEYLV